MDQPQDTTIQHRGLIDRFLNDTPPFRLLVWCFVALLLAAISGIGAMKIETGWNLNASIEEWRVTTTWGDAPTVYTDTSSDPNRAPLWRRTLPLILNVCVFVFGAFGGLLPMWTVGRLISDAIREGNP